MSDDLHQRAQASIDAFKSLSPVEQALHLSDQKRSFIRGQSGVEPPADVLADEVRRLQARVRELEDVLRPFVREGERLDKIHWAHPEPADFCAKGVALLMWGDFRRACAALNGEKG